MHFAALPAAAGIAKRTDGGKVLASSSSSSTPNASVTMGPISRRFLEGARLSPVLAVPTKVRSMSSRMRRSAVASSDVSSSRPVYVPASISDPNYVRIFDTTLRDGEQSPGVN